jgi:hypothetical protein
MNEINRQIEQAVRRQTEQMIVSGMIRNGHMAYVSEHNGRSSDSKRKNARDAMDRQAEQTRDATDPRGTGWRPSQAMPVISGQALDEVADDWQLPLGGFRSVWRKVLLVCRLTATLVLWFVSGLTTYLAYTHGRAFWLTRKTNPKLLDAIICLAIDLVAIWAWVRLWRARTTVYVGEVGPCHSNRFRLQRYDRTGSPLPLLPVEMRGRFKGELCPQDRVKVYGWWSRRRRSVQVRQIDNLTTGVTVTRASSLGIRFQLLLQLCALLGFAIAVFGIYDSLRRHGFSPLPFVGVGILFASALAGGLTALLARMISPDN